MDINLKKLISDFENIENANSLNGYKNLPYDKKLTIVLKIVLKE